MTTTHALLEIAGSDKLHLHKFHVGRQERNLIQRIRELEQSEFRRIRRNPKLRTLRYINPDQLVKMQNSGVLDGIPREVSTCLSEALKLAGYDERSHRFIG